MLSPFYNGVEAPLSYVERLVETLHPKMVFCKQVHKAPLYFGKIRANSFCSLFDALNDNLSVSPVFLAHQGLREKTLGVWQTHE